MKVTKFPQSCLLLEKNGRRIVIDPGTAFTAKFSTADLGDIEAVLYTHQHPDHFDETILDQFKSGGATLYGNKAVSALIGNDAVEIRSGEPFQVAGFNIVPHDLPHATLPDGSPGPQNTGYIIDANFFHPGDGIETRDVAVETVAAPILTPSSSFYQANQLALMVGAKRIIPIHNDLNFIADPKTFKSFNARFNVPVEVIALQNGQSAEL
jgi:L-ascorbate metabolism protein UlaG (beta-lactamase superfamily)